MSLIHTEEFILVIIVVGKYILFFYFPFAKLSSKSKIKEEKLNVFKSVIQIEWIFVIFTNKTLIEIIQLKISKK